MDDINKQNNLLRYLAGMGVVISLLLFAGTCDVKSNNNPPDVGDNNPPGNNPPGNNPPGGGDTACKEGFKIEMAKESYGKAFKMGNFTQDATTGSYSADVTVTLSALTHGNGFVSNHVWLHPDKVAPQAYRDNGVYVHDDDLTKATWTKWVPAVGNATGDKHNLTRDGIFCQGTGETLDTHIDEGAISAIVWLAETRSGTKADAGKKCKDFDVGGVFLNPADGTVQGMEVWVFGADDKTEDEYKLITVTVQPADDIDTTGIYYLRDNFSPSYMLSTGGGDPDMGVADGKLFHANDSDALYAEYAAVFWLGGVPLAAPFDVFPINVNGINPHFTGQNRTASAGYGKPLLAAPDPESLGGNKDEGAGGWQKLFTLKSCDDTMKNGFAVAQALDDDAAVTGWKSKPYLEYTADGNGGDLFQKVVVRHGVAGTPGEADSSHEALLFDSVVGANPNGNNELGLFTIRHFGLDDTEDATDIDNMADAQNAVATKGQIVCRSAIKLETVASLIKFIDDTTNEATLAAITDKVTGYVDGEIKDENKGLGMTCYLGLTALWPEAVDGAPELVKSYNLQFAGDKAAENTFDVSDKKVGILLVNMKKDIAINHEKLKPFFAKPLAENSVLLSKPAGITAVKGLKDGEDVNYKHGVMTLKFVK